MLGHQYRQRTGSHAHQVAVGATGQHDRHPRAQHDAGGRRVGQIFQLLGQHIARFQIGHQQDIGVTRHWGDDALGVGGPFGNGIVKGQRPIQDAAGNLAAVSHLAQGCGIHGSLEFGRHRLHGRENGHLRLLQADDMGKIDGILRDIALFQ